MRENDDIDTLIEILQRVKRCNLALSKLGEAHMNLLFGDDVFANDPIKQKWQKHVHSLIKDCILLITDDK